MMTSVKYCVSWCYREGDDIVRRSLHSAKVTPCIEAARLMNGNPYTYDVEVIETDTGKAVDWNTAGIGRVLYRGEVA